MADDTIKVLRYMEWERAKGSLRAVMASNTDSSGTSYDNWVKLNNMMEKFIKEFGEKAGLD